MNDGQPFSKGQIILTAEKLTPCDYDDDATADTFSTVPILVDPLFQRTVSPVKDWLEMYSAAHSSC